jgi:predicted signal transduction protein with EAL and GGDEF domain
VLLRSLGCTQVQGYYYSRPLPNREFCAWAKSRPSQRTLETPRRLSRVSTLSALPPMRAHERDLK